MAGKPKHAIKDPATGEVVSLRELADCHDCPIKRIGKRFASGQRGWDL